MHVRTPCVGLCSTTFGDLVCRGCKRWAHEITGWNGFAPPEKLVVVQRLTRLRTAVVDSHVELVAPMRLRELAAQQRIDPPEESGGAASSAADILALLRRNLPLDALGCVARSGPLVALDGRALYLALDQEWLARSVGEYEHSTRQRAS